jgi:hypothetical protein
MNQPNICDFNYLVFCLSAKYLYFTILPNVYIMSLFKSTAWRKNGENLYIYFGSAQPQIVMEQRSSDLHSWMVQPCDYFLGCSKEDPNSVWAQHSRTRGATRRLIPPKFSFWITELCCIINCFFLNYIYIMNSSFILVIQLIFSAIFTYL